MAKKKYLKVLLWIVSILLTPIIICLIVMKMPINVNTRNDEDIFKQNNQTYSYSILYGGKEFTDAKTGNVFSSLEGSGIESEIPLGYSMDTGEKHRFISNAHVGYGLEYIYDGNIKKIYPRKYKRIIDYIDPIEYLLIGDYYLLIIDQNSSSSHELLLKNSSIKMPEMKRENIEKIVHLFYSKFADLGSRRRMISCWIAGERSRKFTNVPWILIIYTPLGAYFSGSARTFLRISAVVTLT